MNLITVGTEYAADGHGIVLNPRRPGHCQFTSRDVREWRGPGDVTAGVCRAEADYAADIEDGVTAKLCGPHARHVETCAACARWVEKIYAVGG